MNKVLFAPGNFDVFSNRKISALLNRIQVSEQYNADARWLPQLAGFGDATYQWM